MHPGPKLLALAALTVLVIVSQACGRSEPDDTRTPLGSSPTATPTLTPASINPQVLLRESGAVMESLHSFHFELRHRSGNTPLLANLVVDELEGDVVKPDRLAVEFSGSAGLFFIKSGLIAVADVNYMFNPVTEKWDEMPAEVSPLEFFDPSRGVAAMMSDVYDVSLLPGGTDVHRLTGTLPAEALTPLVGTTVKGATVGVEITIDAGSLHLLEAVFDGRVMPAEPDGTVRVIELSRFNEPITIEAPE